METLLDAADALAAQNPVDPPRPDFDLPEDIPEDVHDLLECRDAGLEKGRGWFARRNLPAGTVLMVAKPLAMVMDWQDGQEHKQDDDNENDEDDNEEENEKDGSRSNELLLLELLRRIRDDPSVWTNFLSELFPRDDETASSLPVAVCHDDSIFLQVEALLQKLEQVPGLPVKDISKRLPLVVRYNALSIETCPELLIHPGPAGHACLSGTGIFHLPSFFNHSANPNVSRYAVGDIMWFVSNQDIAAGDEAQISYLEHDVLCEDASRRTLMLDMDFQDGEDQGEMETQDDGPLVPVVDAEVQNELMQLDAFERLTSIQELMEQAAGKPPTDSDEMVENDGASWFRCDAHNLRIIRAITLESLGQSAESLECWEECVQFTETLLPPNDESSIVMRVQAALSARHAGKMDIARAHAAAALKTHNILFGGGMARFRRRYQREFKLALRPTTGGDSYVDELWPCT